MTSAKIKKSIKIHINLFAEVSSRHNALGQCHSVILKEDQLQLVADIGVVVHLYQK